MSDSLGKSALVIGGSRGLGNALLHSLRKRGLDVYTTIRQTDYEPGTLPAGVVCYGGIDVTHEGAGDKIVAGLDGTKLDLVVISAGVFMTDTIEEMTWSEMTSMMTTCAIGPAFIASALYKARAVRPGGRVLFITTEGGSISLRTKEEGGGNYGHHASKAAANMIGKLLALDFAKQDVTVVDIHPGFMRTQMTKDVGYDSAWDEGDAVTPQEAAESLVDFAAALTPERSGQFWAPRGPQDIGEAERVLGKDLPTPLQLPW